MADTKPTVLGLAADLAIGHTTSRALIEAALAHTPMLSVKDSGLIGKSTRTKPGPPMPKIGFEKQGMLMWTPIERQPASEKDLFDVAGDQTLAGSKALDDRSPARDDAPTRCAG